MFRCEAWVTNKSIEKFDTPLDGGDYGLHPLLLLELLDLDLLLLEGLEDLALSTVVSDSLPLVVARFF